jgi:nucleoside-diphosphate-sugar epimerase
MVSGTCAEYDWEYGYCKEDLTPINPNTVYGMSKDTARKIIGLIASKYGIPMTWARIFFPYGPGESDHRLVPSLFNVFANDAPVFGVNANFYRDLIHVQDAAAAILTCATNQVDGAVNICSGQPITIQSIVEKIAKICNKDPSHLLNTPSMRYEKNSFLIGSNERLKNTGWKQKITLEKGLLDYKF